jgi:hypothetical protein
MTAITGAIRMRSLLFIFQAVSLGDSGPDFSALPYLLHGKTMSFVTIFTNMTAVILPDTVLGDNQS